MVYWDLAALWSFILDYLLLLGTLRLAGRSARRRRLAGAALFGAAWSVAALALSPPPLMTAGAMLAMCRLAFGGQGRCWRLTLLFAMLSCGLGGAVLLLGELGGGVGRAARGVLYARVPWGVFAAAGGLSWLLLTVVFRGGARRTDAELVTVCVEYGGRSVTLRLLRDTGNALSDPLTGEGVPVIEKNALAPLFPYGSGAPAAYGDVTPLRFHAVGTPDGILDAFRCDNLRAGGRDLGARLIAVAPAPFGGRYQGLWFAEEREEKADEVSAAVTG